MPTMTIVRMVLLLTGIVLFAYSLNTGVEWARLAAIGCLAAALLMRLVDRVRRR